MVKHNADITKVNADLNKMLYDYKVAKDMKIMNKTLMSTKPLLAVKPSCLLPDLIR